MKNFKYILATILVVAIVSVAFIGCKKDDGKIDNKATYTNTKGLQYILKIKHGPKRGKWPHQYCCGVSAKYCWLWFQGDEQEIKSGIDYPFARYNLLTNNELVLHVDFSPIVNQPEEKLWKNEMNIGSITIEDDIIIEDSTFSESVNKYGNVTIIKGVYDLTPTGPYSYDVVVEIK